jgi:hypothetical protein
VSVGGPVSNRLSSQRTLSQEYSFCFCVTVTLKGLEVCPKLSALYASRNKLAALDGLEHNAQLWRIDVSDNDVRGVL